MRAALGLQNRLQPAGRPPCAHLGGLGASATAGSAAVAELKGVFVAGDHQRRSNRPEGQPPARGCAQGTAQEGRLTFEHLLNLSGVTSRQRPPGASDLRVQAPARNSTLRKRVDRYGPVFLNNAARQSTVRLVRNWTSTRSARRCTKFRCVYWESVNLSVVIVEHNFYCVGRRQELSILVGDASML